MGCFVSIKISKIISVYVVQLNFTRVGVGEVERNFGVWQVCSVKFDENIEKLSSMYEVKKFFL